MAEASKLVAHVGHYCRHALGLDDGARILAAVSGGADSVAMFFVLHALGYTLEIAHFDHGTRAGASERDAAFVCELAARLGVPYHTGSADVPAEAKKDEASFEMVARRLRYDFLLRTAAVEGIPFIATGHHADDQAETLLMRILRGTSGRGLAGIPPVRIESNARIVRPFLDVRRDAVRSYLAEIGEAYCDDCTNHDAAYARNRIRHELIPMLEREFTPQLTPALIRLADTLRVDDNYLELETAKAAAAAIVGNAIEREAFRSLHEAIRRRVFQRFAWRFGVDCGYERIVQGCTFVADGRTGALFDLGGGVTLKNGARITEATPAPNTVSGPEIVLHVPGTTDAFARQFAVRRLESLPSVPLAAYCSATRQVFDARAVSDLRVRRIRPGDRFIPLGMTGHRKVSDYLSELKLSPSARATQLVLTSGDTLLWIVGHAASAEGAVTESTQALIEVEVHDGNR